jgi:hypothetical protein
MVRRFHKTPRNKAPIRRDPHAKYLLEEGDGEYRPRTIPAKKKREKKLTPRNYDELISDEN